MGCYILVQREGDWAGSQSTQPLLAVPNVTVHPSTASVPIIVYVLLYNGPLPRGFNVPIKGLNVRGANYMLVTGAGWECQCALTADQSRAMRRDHVMFGTRQ